MSPRIRPPTHELAPLALVARLCALIGLACCVAPATAQDLSAYSGAQLYVRFCAACHGRSGHGDGPVASDMSVEVPDITRIAKRRGGTFPVDQIRRVIDGREVHPAHGARYMPVWGYQFRLANPSGPAQAGDQTDQLIDRLVAYLQSLQAR